MVCNGVISGWYIPSRPQKSSFAMVYNPVISGWYIPISGWYIPSTGIQFPKALVVASDPTNQPTEYSCFRDDQASPQALIPVIPSVLVFEIFSEKRRRRRIRACAAVCLSQKTATISSLRRRCSSSFLSRIISSPFSLRPVPSPFLWTYHPAPTCSSANSSCTALWS